jgi:hypothetical protein
MLQKKASCMPAQHNTSFFPMCTTCVQPRTPAATRKARLEHSLRKCAHCA